MPVVDLDLGNTTNPGRDYQDGAGKLINCYPEPRGKEGKSPLPIYSIDGLVNLTELPDPSNEEPEGFLLSEDSEILITEQQSNQIALEGSIIQGGIVGGGVQDMLQVGPYLYTLAGGSFYSTDIGGASSYISSYAKDDFAFIAANRASPPDIGFVSGGKYYVSVNGAVATEVTTNVIAQPNSIVHHDGYFVLTYPDGRFQITNIDDASTLSASDFATAIYKADTLLRGIKRGSDLCLFCSTSVEFWQNTGQTFPFSRVTALDIGLIGQRAVTDLRGTLYWVDNNYEVRRLQGYQSEVVSNPYISQKIRTAVTPEKIYATPYIRDTHGFVYFSTDEFTLVFNELTGSWHEEYSFDRNRRKVECFTTFANTVVAGHYEDGRIYTVSRDAYFDGDNERIFMDIQTPIVHGYPNPLKFKTLWVDHIAGKGLGGYESTPENDPKLEILVSRDGGKVFQSLGTRDMGTINQPEQTIRIDGLGTSGPNGWVFSFRCSASVERGIIGAKMDLQPLQARQLHG